MSYTPLPHTHTHTRTHARTHTHTQSTILLSPVGEPSPPQAAVGQDVLQELKEWRLQYSRCACMFECSCVRVGVGVRVFVCGCSCVSV